MSAEGDKSRRLTEAILQATATLIEESGLDAVTMRGIASRIGYSPTTIYLYFKSKEDLFTSALVYAHEQMAQGLRAAESIGDLRERLRVRATWFVRWGVEHPNTYRLIFEQAPRTPEIGAVAAAAREVWRRHQELIAEAMDSGLIRRDLDPSVNAHLWWATLHGIVWFATAIRFESTIFPRDDAGASKRAELLAESFVTMMLGTAPDPSR